MARVLLVNGVPVLRSDWALEDIRSVTAVTLTDAQCLTIMHTIANRHDATMGINWDVIDHHVQAFICDNELEEA